MQDIAEAAGVSAMTVSYALRNHPSISPPTRERVQRLATEMGYLRNPLVSALMTQIRSTSPSLHLPTIGYLSCFSDRRSMMQNAFRRAYFEGATQHAESLGFRVELIELREQTAKAGRHLSSVLHYRQITGLICGPVPAGTSLPIDWSLFATCAIGYNIREPKLHQVNSNYAHMARIAVERLLSLGYRKIGFACTHLESERVDGEAVAGITHCNRRLPPRQRVAIAVLGPRQWNPAFIDRWLRLHRIDALLFQTHTLYDWLTTSPLREQHPIGIATLERQAGTHLSGIDQEPGKVGALAADMVIDQLYRNTRGIPALRKLVLTEGSWVDGETAPPRS